MTTEHRERLAAFRDARRHPIWGVLEQAASGYVATAGELAALRLPEDARRRVFAAARVAAAFKDDGNNAAAQDHGREAALEIIDGLPAELRRSDYLAEPEPETNDPAALAAPVQRW